MLLNVTTYVTDNLGSKVKLRSKYTFDGYYVSFTVRGNGDATGTIGRRAGSVYATNAQFGVLQGLDEEDVVTIKFDWSDPEMDDVSFSV